MKEIDLDIKSLAYGPVTKYFNKDLWLAHLVWYEEQGYKVYKFDASKWFIIDDFYSDIHDKFEFPGYFGRNWGAVDDLITEIDSGDKGNVLVSIDNFEQWHQEDNNSAHIFLDILADTTYSFLVNGKRFITIIQSNDPNLNVRDVGAKRVHWNWDEWYDRSRGQ